MDDAVIGSAAVAAEIAAWAGAALAVMAVAGRLGLPSVLRWAGRHLTDDLRKQALGGIESRLGRVETLVEQLAPNGGTSLHDRVVRIGDRLDGAQAEQDQFQRDIWSTLENAGIDRRRP